MEKRISDLLDILGKEINLYRELIKHAEEKTALLAQGRLEVILESSKIEETYNIKLRFLENEMKRLCSEIRRISGIASEEFTLIKLAESLEQSLAAELKSQVSLFRTLIMQLKAVSQRNLGMIEKSVKYTRGLLDLISGATSPYQQTGLFRSIPAVQPTFSHRV